MKKMGLFCIIGIFVGLTADFACPQGQTQDRKASSDPGKSNGKKDKRLFSSEEEQGKYYKKWLEEEVGYLISPEEKEIFRKLTTNDERDQFIEQFWQRRNPDPKSSYNAFKEEYYQRVSYANENFTSGIPGWKTDRGMVYIKFGKPDHIEDYTFGSAYDRPTWEGGGQTKVYPTQVWEYRHIEGVGDDVELEFVDYTGGNLYTLTTDPNKKDLLLTSDTSAGATYSEQMGWTNRFDRITNRRLRGNQTDTTLQQREKDKPFNKYMTLANVFKAPQIQYNDLKSLVGTRIQYEELPFRARTDCVKLSEQQVLVPVTVQVANSDLQFGEQQFSYRRATVNLYGIVTTLSGRFVQEFEDDVVKECKEPDLAQEKREFSRYQKFLLLAPGKYKLGLVVKDVNSGKIGSRDFMLDIPSYGRDELLTSSLILSKNIQKVADPMNDLGQFVLGDLKVIPDFEPVYTAKDVLWVYLQLYNLAIDQEMLTPQIDLEYVFEKDGAVVFRYEDIKGSTYKFVAGDRVVVAGKLPVKRLQPGRYMLKIQVKDRISGKTLERTGQFQVEA